MSSRESEAARLPPAAGAETSTGLSPRAAAVLAYSAWWVSGALFLLLEPSHPFVRHHARQSLVVLGGLWLCGLGFWALSLLMVFVSTTAFRITAVLAQLTWAAAAVLWVMFMVRASRGRWSWRA